VKSGCIPLVVTLPKVLGGGVVDGQVGVFPKEGTVSGRIGRESSPNLVCLVI